MQFSDTITGKTRDIAQSGAAHKLVAKGLLPCVVYGPGSQPSHVVLDPKEFVGQRRQYGVAHMFNVEIEGETPFKAFIKQIQTNPLTGEAIHVDLYKVDLNTPIRMYVRIELVGKPIGVVSGGVLSQAMHRIELKGLPGLIPEVVQADVSGLDMGDSLHISDITFPEGVKPTLHHDEAIAIVAEPEKASEEKAATPDAAAAAPAAGAKAAAPAAGAAAKPGAPAAKPAAAAKPAKK